MMGDRIDAMGNPFSIDLQEDCCDQQIPDTGLGSSGQ